MSKGEQTARAAGSGSETAPRIPSDTPRKATRQAYGETLRELVQEGFDLVAVDADLSASTTTAKFGEAYPERFFNVGIAEQNMVGVASGLSLTGKTAFTGSFAIFGTGRAYDQIRNTACYSNLNVVIAPTHAGISVGADGGSHQMLEDIALMRVLPRMRVLVPADYLSAKAALRIAAETGGPFYVRLGRAPVAQIYERTDGFAVGRARVLREGSDVSLIACGTEVEQALAAADLLAESGVSAEVIDAFCLKPLDEETLRRSIAKTGAAVSCEEHSVIGGLGAALATLLAEHPGILKKPLRRVGVQDSFGVSGQIDELFAKYGLDARYIHDCVVECLS
ncbi:MAG: transketolase family protein [Coriobacteriales bacterium]|jgi:transketolase|nr:transketolase family protein [Coriobacteriales bacterium]